MYHVYPINDIKKHKFGSTDCDCGPDMEFTDDGDMMIVHKYFDRVKRELTEKIESQKPDWN